MKIYDVQEAWLLGEVAVGECFKWGGDFYIKANYPESVPYTGCFMCIRLIDGCAKWLKSDAVVMPMDAEIRINGDYRQEDGEDE